MLSRTALLPAVLGFVLHCSAQAVSQPQFEGSLKVPKYEAGYVLDWDSPRYTKITLYAPDTKPVYSLPIRGADGTLTYSAWAADSDGIVARAYHDRSVQGRIELLDVSARVTLTIKTGSYKPTHITFAPDHSLWTLGVELDCERNGEDFNVIRHYARTGEELGQSLLWSQIAGDFNACTALQPVLGGRHLFAARDRIGFISESDRGRSKWIEVEFSGNLLGQYDLGPYNDLYFWPLALTSDGSVYARIFRDRKFKGYAVLDSSKPIWRKISGYPKGSLIGADGDNLVFSELDGGWTVLHTVATAALSVEKPDTQEVADSNLPR